MKKTREKLGNCFETAIRVAKQANTWGEDDVRIVHGTPLGTGGSVLGKRYDHAWVEVTIDGVEIVIDKSNGNDVMELAILYYAAGQIEETRKYMLAQAIVQMAIHRHYGPWI